MHLATPARRHGNTPVRAQRRTSIPIHAAPPRAQPLRKLGCSCGGGCPACQAQTIARPDHPAEREAESVAAQVMSMTRPAAPAGPLERLAAEAPMLMPEENEDTLQRQPAETEDKTLQAQMEEEEDAELV